MGQRRLFGLIAPEPVVQFVDPRFREERPPSMIDLILEGFKGVVGLGGQQPIGSNLDRAQAAGEMVSMAGVPLAGLKRIAKPIKAYHGSPHDFDQFSLDKIGTGEGAQAYGHGLYFAESPEVAKSYADDLGFARRAKEPAQVGGVSYPPGTDRHKLLMDVVDVGKDKALQRLDSEIRFNSEYAPDRANLQRSLREWLSGLNPSEVQAATKGKTYEVNIHADPEDFLDWDAPLSQQSEKVRQALPGETTDGPSGAYWLRDAANKIAEKDGSWSKAASSANVTAKLKEAGIPGIKYLDGASRGKGEGSRNYVVFDDKLIEVVKKYGIAAAVSAGLIGESQARQLKEQGFK